MIPLYYNYIGKQSKTAQIVRKTLLENYSLGLKGVPGNEDSGSMSGWYIFYSLGFYPVAGTDVYLISSPVFTSASVTLDNGKELVIKAKNASDKNIYIKSAKLNGMPLNRSWFRHSEVVNGSVLEFVMDNKPSSWGAGELPPSMSDKQ
jgi:putative alpha-1,2-mannosidase